MLVGVLATLRGGARVEGRPIRVRLPPPVVITIGDAELDVPGLDAPDLRGDALVWEDATFYFEPWTGGASVRFASLGRNRTGQVGRAVPVRILDSSMRSFVEIELPDRADCTWRRLAADPRVDGTRLFVRREDLAPVLTRPYSAQFSDGTRIRLQPGLPVAPLPSGDYLIALKSDRLRLPIPHASVGYRYRPVKVGDADPRPGKLVRIDRGARVTLGSDGFDVRSRWVIAAPDGKQDPAVIELATRCVELTATVDRRALHPSPMYRVSPPPALRAPPTSGWTVPAGAPLSTTGGREIGVARRPFGVAAPTAEAACFDARYALIREDETYATGFRTVRLCAPASLVDR